MGRRIGLIEPNEKKIEVKKEEPKIETVKLDGEIVAKSINKKIK